MASVIVWGNLRTGRKATGGTVKRRNFLTFGNNFYIIDTIITVYCTVSKFVKRLHWEQENAINNGRLWSANGVWAVRAGTAGRAGRAVEGRHWAVEGPRTLPDRQSGSGGFHAPSSPSFTIPSFATLGTYDGLCCSASEGPLCCVASLAGARCLQQSVLISHTLQRAILVKFAFPITNYKIFQ